MGNYSYMDHSDLSYRTSEKKFKENLLVFVLSCTRTTTEENNQELISYLSSSFNEQELENINQKAVAYNVCGYEKVYPYLWNAIVFRDFKNTEKNYYFDGELYLNIDGWKIQGYWYDTFCLFLHYLRLCGLKGRIEMNEEHDQDFYINFNDDSIMVEVCEAAEWDEVTETYIKESNEIEETFNIYFQIDKFNLPEEEDYE
jgi:hypothetical protein